jgi:cytochrome c-type biogenesis protein CcmH
MYSRWIAVIALALAWLVAPAAMAQEPGRADPVGFVEGEKTLEGRLLAPCCWTQTLDVHESESASSLRLEIRRRLHAGESSTDIESDFVARFGERIRAVPKGSSLTGMGVWLSIVVAISGLGVGYVAVRWARRGRRDQSAADATKSGEKKSRDEWDDRLDAEMNDLPD